MLFIAGFGRGERKRLEVLLAVIGKKPDKRDLCQKVPLRMLKK
jgi:hypothetical protein